MNRLLLLLPFLFIGHVAEALTVNIDYTYDTAGFFSSNAAARASLEKAASDIGSVIAPGTLGAITTDQYTGTSGSKTVTFDWYLQFDHPSNVGQTVTLNNFTVPQDTFTIYVGSRALPDNYLGQGGPGSAGHYDSANPGWQDNDAAAVADADQQSSAAMSRGSGPVIDTASGSVPIGNTTVYYTPEYGAILGALWFDNDRDNNFVMDDASILDQYWYFGLSPEVPAGKTDFYSVALHEILHTLGVGTSETWEGLRSGSTWNGPTATAENGGSGANMVSSAHLASGLMSERIDGSGIVQETVMSPSLMTGTRKELTRMDVAILSDLGFVTVPIPEPASAALLLIGASALLVHKRRRD